MKRYLIQLASYRFGRKEISTWWGKAENIHQAMNIATEASGFRQGCHLDQPIYSEDVEPEAPALTHLQARIKFRPYPQETPAKSPTWLLVSNGIGVVGGHFVGWNKINNQFCGRDFNDSDVIGFAYEDDVIIEYAK